MMYLLFVCAVVGVVVTVVVLVVLVALPWSFYHTAVLRRRHQGQCLRAREELWSMKVRTGLTNSDPEFNARPLEPKPQPESISKKP